MSKVKVLFFATLRDRAGTRSLEMDLPEGTRVQELKQRLGAQLPQLLSALDSVLIAVNHEYAFEDEVIPPDSEVALFPPVSGG